MGNQAGKAVAERQQTEVVVIRGIPPQLVAAAADLYLDAFVGGVEWLIGDRQRGVAALERMLDPACNFIVVEREPGSEGGVLVGIAGFSTDAGDSIRIDYGALSQVYGTYGGVWRWLLLRAIRRRADRRTFLAQVMAVSPASRHGGVGRSLYNALVEHALSLGKTRLAANVADINKRVLGIVAMAGLRTVSVQRLGPFSRLFGFNASIAVEREISPEDPGFLPLDDR